MLGTDIIMIQIRRFFIGEFEHFFHLAGESGIAIDLDFRSEADDALHFRANRIVIEIEIAQNVDGDSLAEL